MSNFDDTIAAIATAPGEGGVAIVRVSGPDALKIADISFSRTGSETIRATDSYDRSRSCC